MLPVQGWDKECSEDVSVGSGAIQQVLDRIACFPGTDKQMVMNVDCKKKVNLLIPQSRKKAIWGIL